jgi:uncharacterized protein (TIGR03435 family)
VTGGPEMLRGAIVLMFCSGNWAYGQPLNAQPAFEVASVKQSPPPPRSGMMVGRFGGPGSNDPTRVTFQNFDLSGLVTVAYGVDYYQLSAPSWLQDTRFDVVAKLPDGTTNEQFQLMLQSLLVERFHMVAHREKKEGQVYDLAVGKNGPKLQEAPPESLPEDDPSPSSGPAKLGADGFPALPPGRRTWQVMIGNRASWRYAGTSMEAFAAMLSIQLKRPVIDTTGLKGKYDFTLHWVLDGASDESGPTLAGAIQGQIGLKLEPKKGLIDIVVVDHIDKVPTEN